jgi:tetratricopeptide (TPR) repeat protein
MPGVFLSYSRLDHPLAALIVRRLRGLGVDVWWDEDMPGVDWQDELQQKAAELAAVVVIWTPNSIASRHVKDEARLAREKDKLVNVVAGVPQPPFPYDSVNGLPLDGWTGREAHGGWSRAVRTIEDMLVRAGSARAGEVTGALARRDNQIGENQRAVGAAQTALQEAQEAEAQASDAALAANAAFESAQAQHRVVVDQALGPLVLEAARQQLEAARAAKAAADGALAQAKHGLSTASRALARTNADFEAFLDMPTPAPVAPAAVAVPAVGPEPPAAVSPAVEPAPASPAVDDPPALEEIKTAAAGPTTAPAAMEPAPPEAVSPALEPAPPAAAVDNQPAVEEAKAAAAGPTTAAPPPARRKGPNRLVLAALAAFVVVVLLWAWTAQVQHERAEQAYEASAAAAVTPESPAQTADNAAMSAEDSKDYQTAAKDYQTAYSLYPADDFHDLGEAANGAAWNLHLSGQDAAALPYANQSVAAFTAVKDSSLGYALSTRGDIEEKLGQTSSAIADDRAALASSTEVGVTKYANAGLARMGASATP